MTTPLASSAPQNAHIVGQPVLVVVDIQGGSGQSAPGEGGIPIMGGRAERGPRQRALVDAAAVLGQTFRVAEAATLTGMREADATRVLGELAELGLFTPVSAARFVSARFATVSLHEVAKLHLAAASAEALHREAAALKLGRADHRPGRDDGPIADHLSAARP